MRSLSCRGIDPFEDTESLLLCTSVVVIENVAGVSIRLRILKGPKISRPASPTEVAGVSIRLRILKVSKALGLRVKDKLQGYRSV